VTNSKPDTDTEVTIGDDEDDKLMFLSMDERTVAREQKISEPVREFDRLMNLPPADPMLFECAPDSPVFGEFTQLYLPRPASTTHRKNSPTFLHCDVCGLDSTQQNPCVRCRAKMNEVLK
jgi:hypothetical protein